MDVVASDEINKTTDRIAPRIHLGVSTIRRSQTCLGPLTEPPACVASQSGGFMYVAGNEDDFVTVAISGCTITNCSVVAEGSSAVRAWHARLPFPGVLERERVGGQGVRCVGGCHTAWRAHAAQPIDVYMIHYECANAFISSRLCEI